MIPLIFCQFSIINLIENKEFTGFQEFSAPLRSGGYNLESTQVNDERFLALVLLIAMAYTLATERGKRIRCKRVAPYIAPTQEPRRVQRRHSDFWLGLYGSLWLESMQVWSDWAEQLMELKPQKRPFFQRGLRAMNLIQSAF